MRTWDVIIVGGGIIGLSLAIALRKRGASVLLVERGEPGREASHAAAGMIPVFCNDSPEALQPLATASARMYPEFVHELQDESGLKVDFRSDGTLYFSDDTHLASKPSSLPASLAKLEPALAPTERRVVFVQESSVDPRTLVAATLKAVRHREVDISSGTTVQEILVEGERVVGVKTERSRYSAPVVVNCAGAWAGQLPPFHFPTRPVKGQILSVAGGPPLHHVIHAPDVYLVPRSDGRIVIGATVEEAGYDKRVDPDTIKRLHQSAIGLVPALSQGRILEAWAGLRPGTPDNLPILGATNIPGYYVATGHFRDGILLAPVTAHLMAELITENRTAYDLSPFSPQRFAVADSSEPQFSHAV